MTVLLATIAASGVVQAQYQPDPSVATRGPMLPGAPGYQIGGGLEAGTQGRTGWWSETSITGRATATSNANYGVSNDREGDLIFEVIPAWSFHRGGARLRVDGSISLDFLGYAWGVQTSRILPQANVLANLEAIENLFFVDAAVVANQSVVNPFLPHADFASTNNQYTYAQARLAPYLQGRFGLYGSWLIRSDNTYTWTTQTDSPLGNAYYVNNLAQIMRSPQPFGVTLRLSNQMTRIENQIQPDQTLNTALGIVDYAFTPQFTFGLRGGYENTTYTATETSGPIYGANIAWHPSPTTNLVGYWEERFYGPSYQFNAGHRQRRLASSAYAYRTITTYPQVLFQVPPTNNVSLLLDAILTARFPDPTVRQEQVQDLINRQALPEALPAGTYIYNQSANILTGGSLNFGLLGVRNTLALNLYYLKTQLLPDARIPPTFITFNNSKQSGAGLTLSHALTPVINLNATINGYQSKGFGPTEGLRTRQGLAGLQANYLLSPRSTLFVGTRYQYTKNKSTVATSFDSTSEAAVFAGLFHTFGSATTGGSAGASGSGVGGGIGIR